MAQEPTQQQPEARPAGRAPALLAFFLLATSLLLPWWVTTYRDEAGHAYDREAVYPFGGDTPFADRWARTASGLLAGSAIGLLLVRIAAGSNEHEPAKWRRDLGISCALSMVALALASAWPKDGPKFWGGRSFESTGNLTVAAFTETSNPGLGWWVAVVAGALLALGYWKTYNS